MNDLNNTITDQDQEKWEAQKNLNGFFSQEIIDWGNYGIRTMESLGRAWKKIGALWVFAAGGYITGIAGIVLAVVK